MRVLILTEYMTSAGGVQTYLQSLLPSLKNRVEALAIATMQPAEETVRVGNRDMDSNGIEHWLASDQKQSVNWKPDVVYYHALCSAKLETWYVSTFSTIMYAHNYHGTCASGTKCQSRLGYRTCHRVLGPMCLLCYFPLGCGGINPKYLLKSYPTQRERQRNLPKMKQIFVAAEHMRQEYLRHGVPSDKIDIVPLFPAGGTPDHDEPIDRPFSNRLLLTSRLTKIKGVEIVPEAVKIASQRLSRALELVVAGDGPSETVVRREAARWGIRTQFLNWISKEERNQQMRQSDLLVVPSLWPEPFGLVGIEGGCVGLPSVGFPVGGLLDWLLPGQTGEFASGSFPSAAGLADAIVQSLQDRNHWTKLRIGAWKASQRFSLESHVSLLVQHFQKLVESS